MFRSHRAYKAKWQLRLFLMILNSMSFQGHVIRWVRDHRVHHKYTDTNADPHNATRGFFYSHIGWLMVKKHPDVIAAGKTIDISDLEADPLLRFQRRFWVILLPFFCFILPTFIPIYFFHESWKNSFFVAGAMRYVWGLHITWSVNSFAHLNFGTKPYDKSLTASESKSLALFVFGEGMRLGFIQ